MSAPHHAGREYKSGNELVQTLSLKEMEKIVPNSDNRQKQNHAKSKSAQLMANTVVGKVWVHVQKSAEGEVNKKYVNAITQFQKMEAKNVKENQPEQHRAMNKLAQLMADSGHGEQVDPAQRHVEEGL